VTKTPVTSLKARVSASASSIPAIATSQPRIGPEPALVRIADDRADALVRGQQGARDGTADLARNPGDCMNRHGIPLCDCPPPWLGRRSGMNRRDGMPLSETTEWHIIHDTSSRISHGPGRTTSLQRACARRRRRGGGFARAAEALGLTPSGVSRANRAARSAHRGAGSSTGRRGSVNLTDEGRLFYANINPLVLGIEDACDARRRFIRLRAGPLARPTRMPSPPACCCLPISVGSWSSTRSCRSN